MGRGDRRPNYVIRALNYFFLGEFISSDHSVPVLDGVNLGAEFGGHFFRLVCHVSHEDRILEVSNWFFLKMGGLEIAESGEMADKRLVVPVPCAWKGDHNFEFAGLEVLVFLGNFFGSFNRFNDYATSLEAVLDCKQFLSGLLVRTTN